MTESPRDPPTPPRGDAVALATAPYLTSGVSLRRILSSLVDAVVKNLGADRGTLYLVDGATKTLVSTVAHLPELQRIELEVGQGIAGAVAESGRLLNVTEPETDPRFEAAFDERTGYRTHSLLAVPVEDSRGDIVGVLQVLNAAAGRFGEKDERAALDLARQAGRVLEFTSLHAELRERGLLGGSPRGALTARFNDVIGESEAMQTVYALVEKAAGTDATVLVRGESGTGKGLIARAIHVNGRRKDRPLVKIDCTTLPDTLIENELFGHERGAYTGADRAQAGKFEAADGGTVFLDEVGELPAHVQGKLLRVLQDREFERVGGTTPIRTDVRLVCATHRDLEAMIDAGEFREDLYYRMRVVPIDLPPLRERGEGDLLRLVEHFVERFARRHGREVERLTPAALERLKGHAFPGNIRELENCIESAVVLSEGGTIDAGDLPLAERGERRRRAADREPATGGSVPRVGDPAVPLARLQEAHVRLVLEACGGNQSAAARHLGISRNALARRLTRGAEADEA